MRLRVAKKLTEVRAQMVQNDHDVLNRNGVTSHPDGSWRNCPACKQRVKRMKWKVVP